MIRIASPVLAVSLLLLAVGVGTAWYTNRLQKEITDRIARDIANVRDAERFEIGARELRNRLVEIQQTGSGDEPAELLGAATALDGFLNECERYGITERESQIMAEVRPELGSVIQGLEIAAAAAASDVLAGELGRSLSETLAHDVIPRAHEYLELNQELLALTNNQNESVAARRGLGTLLLGTCGCVAGLVAGFGIARGVSRSIVQLNVPIRDAAGKLNEVVGPITLSTSGGFEELAVELHKLAGQIGTVVDQLQQSQREVLHAEQLAAIGQLAAGMAHELRNPLMAMKLLVESALERNDEEGLGGRDLEVIHEEIIRQEQAIQTFLDFARPPQLEKRLFDVRMLAEQTVHLLESRAAQQDVAIQCNLPDRPLCIDADMGQIRQVLLNLLVNALDAIPNDGTVAVQMFEEITAAPGGREDAGLRWLTIQVADTGCGLPAELGNRIFEPFVSKKETGTGLGLSLCKHIVEAHGGTIAAANQPARGAVFTVRLPMQPGAPHDAAARCSTEAFAAAEWNASQSSVCNLHS